MLYKLEIECGEMDVTNTGAWYDATADRMTAELPCRGHIFGPIAMGFSYTFPQCLVTFVEPGLWQVAAFQATGLLDDGNKIWFDWPAEMVKRKGRYMMAQPVTSIDGYVSINGVRYYAEAKLPLAQGTPWFPFGARGFTVEAVTVPGVVVVP